MVLCVGPPIASDLVVHPWEVGPLKQLKSMIKRIDQDAFKRTENISV